MARNCQKPRFPVDWRLLVKECIANIGIPLDFFLFWRLKKGAMFLLRQFVTYCDMLHEIFLHIRKSLASQMSVLEMLEKVNFSQIHQKIWTL